VGRPRSRGRGGRRVVPSPPPPPPGPPWLPSTCKLLSVPMYLVLSAVRHERIRLQVT
jgi:hypothetical protein